MVKLLEVDGLTKNFGKITAVDQLSFSVKKGELFGIVGANGAGKTTLFRLLMGDFKQDAGSIFFEGQEISSRMKHQRVRMGLSRTHQIPQPFRDMSVADNIRIGGISNSIKSVFDRTTVDKSAEIVAGKLGLKGDILKFPKSLSLAKTKKLEFARALATNPKIVLVDEVFAGISPAESAELSNLIRELNANGTTIVMIDHNIRILMKLAQRIMAIEFGKKIAEGTPAEIVSNQRVIQSYLGLPDEKSAAKFEKSKTTDVKNQPGGNYKKQSQSGLERCSSKTGLTKNQSFLKVSDLNVFYGKARAIRDVSFEVNKFDFVGFIGANGAGKSTIVDSISNLTEWQGQILYNQVDISKFNPAKIVKLGITNCPERRNIFPFMNVEENLLMGAYSTTRNIKKNLDFVFDLFPMLKERLKQVASNMSGGEQRMLALGRSLMSNPELLMIDEPTLGLAPVLVKQLSQTLGRLKGQLTVLLMEQNVNLALDLSDRIYVLEMGQIVKSGTTEEIKSEDSIRETYLPHSSELN